jgi:hypothetical protein
MAKNPNEKPNIQQDTEFAEETNPARVVDPNQTVANEPEQKEDERAREEKGGNNPRGANQYTSGRVDDRGRKE